MVNLFGLSVSGVKFAKYNMAGIKLQPVSIEGIEFDALINETKSYSAQIPTYPVEEGFPVSDTIINDPISVKMTLLLTPTPVTWMFKHKGGYMRMQTVIKQLEELYLSKKLVKVVTCETTYTDMAITNIDIGKTQNLGYMRQVDIGFQKVRVTSKQTTDIPDDIAKSGDTQANAGAAVTSDSANGGNYGGGENNSGYEGADDGESSNASSSDSATILGSIFGGA